ncbi:hypothetical protein [Pseudomonas taeanensis]|jgi:hypothetical protein|uniref:hypothetical protein n=1 Tax=Pseudomonas taeanensis TaxID=574962 RepID=UPI0004B0405C|nr:hypothetical protein [Pseudomonas taeanensis]
MTTHTEHTQEVAAPQGFDSLSPLLLLEPLNRTPDRPKKDEDWRLSRSAKPLRTWRLSK